MAFARDQYDVILVNPPAEAVREHWDAPDFPNISLAYIGAYLEEFGNTTPAIIDAKHARMTHHAAVDEIVRLRPRIVGITCYTFTIFEAAKLASSVRERLPGTTIVLGGFHATALPEPTLSEFPVFDILVLEEGELTFQRLVDALLRGGTYDDIPGLAFRRGETNVVTGRRELPPSIDAQGRPGWHLFDPAVLDARCETLQVMSTRGCPFSCNFCSRPYGQTVRKRSPEQVAEEIEMGFREYGVRHFAFNDETFTVNAAHVRGICDDLIRRGLQDSIHWDAMVHANTVTPDLLARMKAAGCNALYFGVESGNEEIIARMNKGVTRQKILRCARLLKDSGIYFGAMFIIGHPHETRRTVYETIRLAIEINAPHTIFGIMVPYPGTEIWKMALEGRGGYKKLSPEWKGFNKQIGHGLELVNMSRREMEILQMLSYLSFFLFTGRLGGMFRAIVGNWGRLRYLISKNLSLRSRPRLGEPAR